jgi:hypothetical protein
METRDTYLKTVLTLGLCLLIGSFTNINAQQDEFWADDFGTVGALGPNIANTIVWETLSTPEGVYAGGTFTYMDGIKASGIALWDGTEWSPLGSGITQSGGGSPFVYAIYKDGDNIYVGGLFDMAGGIPVNNIAVWNTADEEWSALGDGADDVVYTLVKEGNNLYAGGEFSNAGGNSAINVAVWNTGDELWTALGSGTDGRVNDLEIIGGLLYAGGNFSNAGGSAAANLATWNGTTWAEFEGGTDARVREIAAVDTSIYIGGDFGQVDGNSASFIARWDGSAWNSLSTEPNDDVYTIKGTPEGVLVGGTFTQVGISEASGIARWTNNGWETLNQELVYDFGTVSAVVSVSETQAGEYLIGGLFSKTSNLSLNNVALLNSSLDISQPSSLGSANGIVGLIYDTDAEGENVYAAGIFGTAQGADANNVAHWDGSQWSALGEGTNGEVNEILVADGMVYVGGSFTEAGGNPANNIAVWNIANQEWSALGDGTDNDVQALLKVGDNLFVGGRFSNAGTTAAENIAMWDTDASTWSALGAGVDNDVNSLATIGGNLVVGGSFSNAGGNSANHVATWNGSSWNTLAGGTDGDIETLHVADTLLYVGGSFSNADGSTASNIAVWNNTDEEWSSIGTGLDNTVATITTVGDALYAGGSFQNAGLTETALVAKWDGSTWSSLGSGISDDLAGGGVVATFSVTSDEKLYVGGLFVEAGNKPSTSFTYWDLNPTAVSNETDPEIASDFSLSQNYPNPFNPTTNITYNVPSQGNVTLKVFNMLGQEVATLVNGVRSSGDHTVTFDASKLSSGMYIYRLNAGNTSLTKKMMLIK